MKTHTLDLCQEAQQQNNPKGSLYIVATPIGNIADFSHRALVILDLVDCIACEDTRHSGLLLAKLGLKKKLLSHHQHSENASIQDILSRLATGERVAYISDAGTPGISDPGAKLVQAVQQAGFKTIPIGGVSAVTTLLSVAGEGFANYYFMGFLPPKTKAFEEALLSCLKINQQLQTALVFYEASHRIYTHLEMVFQHFKQHKIVIGRELSKQFETLIILTPEQSEQEKKQILDELVLKGEFCVAISKPIVKAATHLNALIFDQDNQDNYQNSPENEYEAMQIIYPHIYKFFMQYLDVLGAKSSTATVLDFFASDFLIHPTTFKKLTKKDLYDWALYLKK